MNSRLDTLLRKQLPYQDYINVRFCEVCVVEENKKIELRYLVLTNSALWSCEYPNPRQLSSLLDLRNLRKIDVVHDFPCFLSGKHRQNCLHLQLLREKLSPASVIAKKPEVLPSATRTQGSESTIPKLRKVSLMVTLLQRWRKKTLDNNEIDESSSSLSDDASISSSNSSEAQQYLWSGVKSRLMNQYQNLNQEKTDSMEDSESNLGSLPCSLPDSSSVVDKSLNLETRVLYSKLHIYVLKGESPFYRLLHLTWKSCLLNDLACENENPKRHHLQTLWDSQKRLVFQMPDETDARLENLTSYLRRFPALKFYVWKDVGFLQHVIEHSRRHLCPPEVVTWQTQRKRHEVSIRGQQRIAQILSFLAECLRGYLVPKPYYESRNAFHANLMECCIRATRLAHSRTSALSCAFEILHSWQEGQSLQLCYGNLFAKLTVDLQEHLAQILLEDISNGDWQYPIPSRYEAAIRNGTLLLALLEHLDGYPFSIIDGYQASIRSMSLCELCSPLQPFWEAITQGLLRFNVETRSIVYHVQRRFILCTVLRKLSFVISYKYTTTMPSKCHSFANQNMKHLKMKICVLYVVVAFLKVYRCTSLPVDPDPVEIIHEKLEKDRLQDAQENQAEKVDLPSIDVMSPRAKRSIFDTPRILNEVDGPINAVQHHKGVWRTTPFVLTSTNPPETTTLAPTTTSSTESPVTDEIPIWLQLIRLFVSPLFYSEETTPEVSVEADFTTQALFTSSETEPATTEGPTTTTNSTTAEPPATTVAFGLNPETNAIDKPRIFVQLIRLIVGPMFELEDQPDTPPPNTEEPTALPITPTTQEPTTPTISATLPSPSFEFRRGRTVFSRSTEPAFVESTEPGQPIGVEVEDNNNAAMINPTEPQPQWNPFVGPRFFYFPPRFDFAGPAF